MLRQAGYFTGVAGRTYHLDGSNGRGEIADAINKHNLKTFPHRLDFVKTGSGGVNMLGQYREFLDAVPKDKPFFLQLCSNDPHRPFDKNAIPQPHDPKTLTLPAHFPDTQAVREDFAHYYDEIARFDGHFAQILAELDKRGLADNTIVVFMGDNGAALWRGKGTLYEFGIHVPLLVRWPGVVKPGSATAELVSGEDIGPTLLEACGQTVPKVMTGKSFAPLLKGEKFTGREYIFAERGAHGAGLPGSSHAFDLGRVVVSKTHKLIYNATFDLPYIAVDFGGTPMFSEVRELAKAKKLPEPLNALYDGRPRPMIEVYDLANDPNEFHNLAGTPAAAKVQQQLRTVLIEWMTLEHDYLPLPITPVKNKRKK